jgi:hypothetical protein
MRAGGFLTAGARKKAIRGASGEIVGLKQAVAFMAWMSSREKNSAVRQAYRVAVRSYINDLRQNTPKSKGEKKLNKKGKPAKHMKNTMGVAFSRKKFGNIIDPMYAGHMLKKGAYHQQLLVDGTGSWRQDGTPLQRSSGGSKVRKKVMKFKGSKGEDVFGKNKKAVKGNNYVKPVAARHIGQITNDFGNSFILGMQKEARSAKYQGYLSY